jgi:hypothetical protein
VPVISALRRWKQENDNLEASLGYIARPCLKKPKGERNNNKRAFIGPVCR